MTGIQFCLKDFRCGDGHIGGKIHASRCEGTDITGAGGFGVASEGIVRSANPLHGKHTHRGGLGQERLAILHPQSVVGGLQDRGGFWAGQAR